MESAEAIATRYRRASGTADILFFFLIASTVLLTLPLLGDASLIALLIFGTTLLVWRVLRLVKQHTPAAGAFFFPAALLGFLTPIAPAFGVNTLLVCALLFLISIIPDDGSSDINPLCNAGLLAAFSILFVNCLLQISMNSDFMILGEGIRLFLREPGAAFNVYTRLAGAGARHAATLQYLLRGLLLVALFLHFGRSEESRRSFLRGLLPGLAVALIAGALEISGSLPAALRGTNEFWAHQGRFRATFTDPNALGVFAVLTLPVLQNELRSATGWRIFLWFTFACAWLLLATFSGSRTFFLGVFLFVILSVTSRLSGRRSALTIAATFIAGAALVLMLNALEGWRPEVYSSLMELLPSGGRRLMETLSIARAQDAFFSRSVFWQMGALIWLDHPFIGIGLGRFREKIPEYSALLGSDLKGWLDNSNNFYLGMLAEAGIPGLLGLLVLLTMLRRRDPIEPGARYALNALYVLLLLLLLGPHFEFEEVVLITSYLMANALTLRPMSLRAACAFAMLALFIVLPGVYARESSRFRGFYSNRAATAPGYLWTGSYAGGTLDCAEAPAATISIKAPHPDIGRRPLEVRFKSECESEEALISLRKNDPIDLKIDCKCSKNPGFWISVARLYSPPRAGAGGDPRFLGLQVKLR